MIAQVYEVEAITRQRKSMRLDESSALELVTDEDVAENGNALSRDDGIDGMQFFAEVEVASPVDGVAFGEIAIDGPGGGQPQLPRRRTQVPTQPVKMNERKM